MFEIPIQELEARRRKLYETLPEYGVLILFGGEVVARNADTEYSFRQQSDFWYFTGINEPDAIYVLKKTPAEVVERLYVQPSDPTAEVWTGYRLGAEKASQLSGIEDVRVNTEFRGDENFFVSQVKYAYLDLYESHQRSHRMWLSKLFLETERRAVNEHVDGIRKTQGLTRDIRMKKSSWEIEMMQKSADIAVAAHKVMIQNAAQRVRNGEMVNEAQMMADFLHGANYAGAGWSYMPIVAGGANACILHYVENNRDISPEDMVLVDAGAELGYYASDITRTYPISGTFSGAQKAVYEVVLEAEKQVIEMAAGDVRMMDMHAKSIEVLTAGLVDLGILSGNVTDLIEEKAYSPYFMHGTGHYLGLDVHDVGPYRTLTGERASGPFTEGMAITVEPGLYFGKFADAPEEFQGIGVRIEDNIVKTKDGTLNLTEGMEKEVVDVEKLIQQA